MKLFYAIHNAINNTERFGNSGDGENSSVLISYIITMIIYVVLVLLLGKWIWNNVLVKLVSGVNKIKNPIDLILLSILFSLLFGTM